MTLEMRKLKGQDTFTILRLLSKLGVKDLVSEIFANSSTPEEAMEDVRERGSNLIAVLVEALTEKLPEVQDELNAFLADLTETDVATIMDLDFEDYIGLIITFFKKEELVNFTKQLSSLSGMGSTSSKTSSTNDTAM